MIGEVDWRRALGVTARIGAAHAAHVAVVDRRAVGAERVRTQHPEVHRDAAGRVAVVAAERGAARPRVLVLLRHRPDRPLDRGERAVHAEPRAARRQLRHPGARAARRRCACGGATAPYFVVLTFVGVVVAVGANPYDDPSIARRAVQVVRGVVELRARVAQHQPRGAAGRARPRGAARRRRERGRRRVAGAGAPGARRARCARSCWRAW